MTTITAMEEALGQYDELEPAPTTTMCWNCNAEYEITAELCPKCCATNANFDLQSAQIEMNNLERIEHDWEFQDDSFDHEYGTEQVHYWQCTRCGKNAPMDAGDYGHWEE